MVCVSRGRQEEESSGLVWFGLSQRIGLRLGRVNQDSRLPVVCREEEHQRAAALYTRSVKSGMEKVTEYSAVVQLLERKKSDEREERLMKIEILPATPSLPSLSPMSLVVLVVWTGDW